MHLLPVWQPRFDAECLSDEVADLLVNSSDEWGICDGALQQIQVSFNITFGIDAFAAEGNARAPNYFTRYPSPNAVGTDFMSQDFDPIIPTLLCPPVSMIHKVWQKILAAKEFSVVLLVPTWPAQSFLNQLFIRLGSPSFIRDILRIRPHFVGAHNTTVFKNSKLIEFVAILMEKPGKFAPPVFPNHVVVCKCE